MYVSQPQCTYCSRSGFCFQSYLFVFQPICHSFFSFGYAHFYSIANIFHNSFYCSLFYLHVLTRVSSYLRRKTAGFTNYFSPDSPFICVWEVPVKLGSRVFCCNEFTKLILVFISCKLSFIYLVHLYLG